MRPSPANPRLSSWGTDVDPWERAAARPLYLLAAGLIAAVAIGSAFATPLLPFRMAVHWGPGGEPDAYLVRPLALLLLPGAAAGLLGLFALLPRIDPLGENVAAFRRAYDAFALLLVAFLLVLHVGVLAWNAGVEYRIVQLVAATVGVLFVGLGALLRRTEPNWFVGIRTPWTMHDDRVWHETHRLAGTLFKLAGVVAFLGVLLPDLAVAAIVVPAVGAALLSVVYSYVVYRRVA